MKRIFISSPYTIGDKARNVSRQMEAASDLIDAGFAPYWPLHSHFIQLFYVKEHAVWLDIDKSFLLTCDAVLRLPGPSKGADIETAFATQNGIPVFYNLNKLLYELH